LVLVKSHYRNVSGFCPPFKNQKRLKKNSASKNTLERRDINKNNNNEY
jgi:hypothetical protein